MPENAYYYSGERIPLDTEETKAKFTSRLRQYLEVRNFCVLIGNGCSIPLGAPLIHNAANIIAELDSTPYSLEDSKNHKRARELLDSLLTKDKPLGVESLLTLLASVQAA